MAQDGLFIKRLAKELNDNLNNGRVDNAFGLNKTDYVLDIRVPGKSYYLYMSASYNNPTVFMTQDKFEKPSVASNFTMLLRKYLVGSFITDIKELNDDRIIEIDFIKHDELIGNEKRRLIIELIGRFSNILLLDDNMKIIDAIKQLSVLENNSRGIMRGLEYTPLKNDKLSQDNKDEINQVFSNNDNLYPKKLMDSVSGLSPLISEYLINKYKDSNEEFYNFFIKNTSSFNPTLTDKDYYYFDVFNDKNSLHFNTLSELLNHYYKVNAEAKILKDNNQKVYQTVSSNIKRLNKKLVNLSNDLNKDLNSDDLRIKGEILMANAYKEFPRTSSITLNNFYDGKDIEIQIDPSKNIKDNATIYFKKYKKTKAAIEHLTEQIDIATSELEYFKLLDYQLKTGSLKDILEIKAELINNNYLKDKNVSSKKNKQKPNFLEIKYEGSKIYVGKNNLQNDYLTHTVAKKDDLWFHIKDGHGSHVIVSGDTKNSEDVIRKAAFLAATYSEAKDSSSVAVDYTLVRYLKKIPGRKGSFVSYTHQKTIYIDPKREN